jgi:dCMP deaminase
MRAAILYFPVIHNGYLNFIAEIGNVDRVFVIESSIALELEPSLRKDIRALKSDQMVSLLSGSSLIECDIYELTDLSVLDGYNDFVMPDEEISHEFFKRFLDNKKSVEFVSVFLRWDKKRSLKETEAVENFAITSLEFDRKMILACKKEASRSGDWWRQVGGCIVKNGTLMLPAVHNIHVPKPDQAYYDGDPRSNFSAGKNIELGTALHVELNLIAMAAEVGLSLSGSHLYVTTFPCPWCAKAIAYSGSESVYFEEGYAVLDAQTILEDNGVEIVRVIK